MKSKLIYILLGFVIIFSATKNLNFGLPHSFYADEPEIAEPAIKYAFTLKEIIKNNDYYQLIPVSFVYGTVPVYFLSVLLMIYSKINSLLNIQFPKEAIYIFFRFISSLLFLGLIPMSVSLQNKINNKYSAFLLIALVGLNWKLLMIGHYVNQDIYVTFLTTLFALSVHEYFMKQNASRKLIVCMGAILGLMFGTKITAFLSIPAIIYMFALKKDWKNFIALGAISFGFFALTNPFSIAFGNDFALRIIEMSRKEAGVVIDSIDLNPLKYVFSLAFISTWPVLVLGLFGIFKNRKSQFSIFLIINIITYLVFYSLSARRVDRWLAPILPFILVYASLGFNEIWIKLTKLEKPLIIWRKTIRPWIPILILAIVIPYGSHTTTLLLQLNEDTPKSSAYKWMTKNSDSMLLKLAITEEGLDPLNKLPNAKVIQFNVYQSDGAFLELPPPTDIYDYIIISSKPKEYFDKPIVMQTAPYYYQMWKSFYDRLNDPKKYKLIYEKTLPKPNLAYLSDVYIYQKVR